MSSRSRSKEIIEEAHEQVYAASQNKASMAVDPSVRQYDIYLLAKLLAFQQEALEASRRETKEAWEAYSQQREVSRADAEVITALSREVDQLYAKVVEPERSEG